jgi:hypothetical protein
VHHEDCLVCREVPCTPDRSPVRPGPDLKHLVAALAGFGAGWSAHQIWTRLNAPLPDSPVVQRVSLEDLLAARDRLDALDDEPG